MTRQLISVVSGTDVDQIASYVVSRDTPSMLLVNDANVQGMRLYQALSSPAFLGEAKVQVLTSVGGCACCTSSVAMRVELSRLIRAAKDRATRLTLVTNHWKHSATLLALLQSAPFDLHLVIEKLVWLGPMPEALKEPLSAWVTHRAFELVSTNTL